MTRRAWDVIERALWTLVQTTTAGALIAGWNALDLGGDLSLAWAAPVAFVLSAIKGELAARFGNGTASTLPARLETVPAPPAPPAYNDAPVPLDE